MPWVRSARVRRELPDRVVVRVREYRPAAILAVADLRPGLYYVAANGRIFAPVGATDGRDLPYITGLAPGRSRRPRRRSVRSAVHRALGLLRLVARDAGGVGAVSEVHVDRGPRAHAAAGAAGDPDRAGVGRLRPQARRGSAACCRCGRSAAAEVREVSCIFDDQVIVRLRAPLPAPVPGRAAAGA